MVSKTIGWEFESLHPCKILSMSKLKSYVLDSYDELRNKVSWPTLKELQSSSVLVLVASFIMAGIVYLLDASFGQVMQFIYDAVY